MSQCECLGSARVAPMRLIDSVLCVVTRSRDFVFCHSDYTVDTPHKMVAEAATPHVHKMVEHIGRREKLVLSRGVFTEHGCNWHGAVFMQGEDDLIVPLSVSILPLFRV